MLFVSPNLLSERCQAYAGFFYAPLKIPGGEVRIDTEWLCQIVWHPLSSNGLSPDFRAVYRRETNAKTVFLFGTQCGDAGFSRLRQYGHQHAADQQDNTADGEQRRQAVAQHKGIEQPGQRFKDDQWANNHRR